jgi:hypothetical protein
MKAWVAASVLGLVGLCGLRSAWAAPPKITMTIDKSFGAEITATAGAKCTTPWGDKLTFPRYVKADGYDDILEALISDSVTCSEGKSEVKAEIKVELAGETYFPFAVMPREYQWAGPIGSWVEFALSRLGTPTSCSAAERGKAPVRGDDSCKLIFTAARYSFTLAKPFDYGEIVVDYGANKSIRLPVYPCQFDTLGPLPGIVAGATEQLVYLQLSEKTPNCRLPDRTASMTLEDGTSVGLAQIKTLGNMQQGLRLTDVPKSLKEGAQTLKLHLAGGLVAEVRTHVLPRIAVDKLVVKYNMPANLDTYGHFAAASGDAAMDENRRFIAVVSPEIELPDLEDDAVVNTAHLSWPSALIASSSSLLDQLARTKEFFGIVAKRRAIEEKRKEADGLFKQVTGPAKVDGTPNKANANPTSPGKLQQPNDSSEQKKTNEKFQELRNEIRKLESEIRQETQDESSYFVWSAKTNNPKLLLGSGKGRVHKQEDVKEDLQQISFVVNEEMPHPPTVTLQLAQTIKFARDEKVNRFDVLKLDIPLAAKARVESLPLPARDMLEVVCNDEKVGFWNSEVHAIGETALAEGECRVQLKPQDAQVPKKDKEEWKKTHQLLRLYGPQTFSVIVRRGGVEDKQLWQFSPTTRDEPKPSDKPKEDKTLARQPFWSQSLTLGEPKSDTKTDAYYTVEIRPIARQDIAVAYRKSSLEKIDETDVKVAGELTFTTRLRSRGMFAIPYVKQHDRQDGVYKKPLALRTYLSLSVIASALRMPAAKTDRPTSTSSTDIQYVSPVVGALWSWELWDYDRGKNPVPLNPTLQVGGHFYKTANGDITFNPLGGIAMTLPVIQEETPVGSQLSSKATLGLYFEVDTRDMTGHALLAVSANIGSLLSGK